MKRKLLKLKKLTSEKWVNLFESIFVNSKDKTLRWNFASRKVNPIIDQSTDVVVIVPVVEATNGESVVLVKEYRASIGKEAYDFPAGLIEPDQTCEEAIRRELKEETGLELKKVISMTPPLYSSPGLTDESAIIAFVEAEGQISTSYQEEGEDIEVVIWNIEDIKRYLWSNLNFGAKAWTILYHYYKIGRIE